MSRPSVDADQARAVRGLLASFRPPYLGDAPHQPTLVFRSAKTSRVVCSCGDELGVVSVGDGMAIVMELHAAHVRELS